jgi:hypothetical protein
MAAKLRPRVRLPRWCLPLLLVQLKPAAVSFSDEMDSSRRRIHLGLLLPGARVAGYQGRWRQGEAGQLQRLVGQRGVASTNASKRRNTEGLDETREDPSDAALKRAQLESTHLAELL